MSSGVGGGYLLSIVGLSTISNRSKNANFDLCPIRLTLIVRPRFVAVAAVDLAEASQIVEMDEIKASTVRFDHRFVDTMVCLRKHGCRV